MSKEVRIERGGVLTPRAADVAIIALIQRFHPHLGSLPGEDGHHAPATRLTLTVGRCSCLSDFALQGKLFEVKDMRLSFTLLVALAVLLLACNPPWNALQRNTLRIDVAEVLGIADADQRGLVCNMVGTSRTGYCLFEAEVELVERLAAEFELEELGPGSPLLSEGQVGCLTPEALGEAEGLQAQGVEGRPGSLALGSGGQFEYLLLLYNASTDQACVQVSYAYG